VFTFSLSLFFFSLLFRFNEFYLIESAPPKNSIRRNSLSEKSAKKKNDLLHHSTKWVLVSVLVSLIRAVVVSMIFISRAVNLHHQLQLIRQKEKSLAQRPSKALALMNLNSLLETSDRTLLLEKVALVVSLEVGLMRLLLLLPNLALVLLLLLNDLTLMVFKVTENG
jgi:hypothetical protein